MSARVGPFAGFAEGRARGQAFSASGEPSRVFLRVEHAYSPVASIGSFAFCASGDLSCVLLRVERVYSPVAGRRFGIIASI